MKRIAAVVWLALACARASLASAQMHRQAQPPALDAAETRVPPSIESLPALDLPKGVYVAPEDLELLVRVEIDGHAVIEEASATGVLRSQIEALIAQARFTPARIGDKPMPALVRIKLAVTEEPPEPDLVTETSARADTDAGVEPVEDIAQLGARAEVDPPRPGARKLKLAEMRDVPGAFGDPFRVLDTLPGVVPLFSGLPYVYVRGAPPAGTIYVYDGIVLPSLFHLALGPAVIHAALIGDLQFYPAVPPARFGRRTGGVFAAESKQPSAGDPTHAELELRLLDVSAMVDIALPGNDHAPHRLTLGGRYGYPGLLLSIFSDEAQLAYWDYQTKYRVPIGGHDRFELTWFGAYDFAGAVDDPEQAFSLEFHRAEARVIRERDDFEIGFALQGGFERSGLGEEVEVYAWRLGPRIWTALELSDRVRARFGADMLAAVGEIIDRSQIDFGGSEDTPGAFGGEPDISRPGPTPDGFPQDPTMPPVGTIDPMQMIDPAGEQNADVTPFDNPLYAAVAGRNLGGVYGELEIDLNDELTLAPGLRADAWLTGSRAQAALEPRLMTTYAPNEWLELHLGGGLGHQVAALPIALPGFNDVALEHGLQQAISSELGAAVKPLEDLRLEATLYYNHLSGLLLPDLFIECSDDSSMPLCPPSDSLPRGDVDAYGVEVFLKRDSLHNAVSGWLSYTLGWADGYSSTGVEFTPSFDVRHIANLVVQTELGGGFAVGLRGHYRTGKIARADVYGSFVGPFRLEERLPGFFRADAQIIYGWLTDWGSMRVSLEWMNLTMSEEPIGLDCNFDDINPLNPNIQCDVDYAPAIFFPNLGVRGEI